MFAVSMPNRATSCALVDTATKCLAMALSSLQARQRPLPRRLRVGHGFQRGEGLGGDDEQCLGGIEVAHRFGEIRAVDIGDEAERHRAVAVVAQRVIGHDRTEIGAADADIDQIANTLAGMTLPIPAAHPVGKIGHLVKHGVHIGHDVSAIDA